MFDADQPVEQLRQQLIEIVQMLRTLESPQDKQRLIVEAQILLAEVDELQKLIAEAKSVMKSLEKDKNSGGIPDA